MAIDKRIPRVLDSDSDNKTVNKVSMKDALNVYAGPDNEGFSGGSKSDAGNQILKNIRGNTEVFVHEGEELPTDARVIGFVEDVKTDITYFFVYSSEGSNHGVWAYDKNDILNTLQDGGVQQGPSIRLIYKSAQFNFPQNGFVKADVVYTNASKSLNSLGVAFDKDAVLYFTDGVNEPRKINTYRAFSESSGSNIHGDSVYAEADFICACAKTPLRPIEWSFESDESRSTTNFATTEGFQFAYQYVYKDGIESAISSYSTVAFPPSVLFQGAQPYVDHNAYNKCVLRVPFSSMPGYLPETNEELSSIKILAKQGLNGRFLIIDEIEADNITLFGDLDTSNQTFPYHFFNDRISTAVSNDEVNKQFQSVPRSAVTQAVSSNRLIYGNYVDGFDPVSTQCTAYAIYKDAPENFVSLNVGFNPTIEEINEGGGNAYKGTSSGFSLDFTGFSEEVNEGTEFLVNVSITPNKNWHVWRMRNVHSFQQTNQVGVQEQVAVNNLFSGINDPSEDQLQTNEDAGVEYLEGENTIFGGLAGLTDTASNTVGPPDQIWRTVDDTGGLNFGDTPNVRYGTSAANPLILKGGTLFFSARIRSTETITSNVGERLRDAFLAAFLDGEQDGFEVINVKSSSDYDINVGLISGQTIKQDRIRSQESTTDSAAKLISAVKVIDGPVPPGGYFIVNKANVSTSLRPGDDVNPLVARFRIKLDSVSGVGEEEYPDVYTCIHDTSSSFSEDQYQPWIAISKEDLESFYGGGGPGSISSWLESKSLPPTLEFHNVPEEFGNATGIAINTVSKQIGYLVSPNLLDFEPYTIGTTEFLNQYCFMDGEGGPGGGPSNSYGNDQNPYDYNRLYYQGSITVNPSTDGEEYAYGETVFYTGRINTLKGPSGVNTASQGRPHPTVLPLLFKTSGAVGASVGAEYEYLEPTPELNDSGLPTGFITPAGPNLSRVHSTAEISSAYFNSNVFDDYQMSFKTEANHDFGIIYYDQRGRHGFVNPLKSVFVEGYSDSERPEGGKGPVEIYIKLEHSPPEWAHGYKIAYSKNTSVSDFIQYSSGGAFVKNSDIDQDISGFSNIYISLNYLQGNPISYVSSFGARSPEGGLNLYKYQEGDKLRVISYFEGSDREYKSYEFDVVDLVKLGDTDNPLVNDNESVPDFKKGDFVVIKNNPDAFGFTHGEVLSGASFWDNNCIIELRTPKKDVDAEQTIFYELPEFYRVVRDDDGFYHEETELYLKNGDVFFRPVAVNAREFEGGVFNDLIGDPQGDEPKADPNFKNLYLESMTATDLFRGDNIGLGRPNIISKDSIETVREATVTYSDPTNPEGKKLNYSSFNASLANFKDLSEKYGPIQYMSDHNEYLVVIQKEKISIVPVNKNILANADGSQQVFASTSVLNEAILYPGVSGCDDDPSSVYDSGEEVYFCNKTFSKIYRWTRNSGVEEISEKGISSVIRAAIQRAQESGQLRIIGGFDPIKDEYLFTLDNPAVLNTQNAVEALQPIKQAEEDDDSEEDEDESSNLPTEAYDLAEALNNFYPGSTYTAEDMSAQLAIEYLQALAFSPSEDQPTGNQIKQLLNSVNENSMKRLVLDTYGDNNNAVSDTTDSQDFLGLIGPNGVLGDTFDPGLSIFQDNEVQTGLIPPPVSNNPPPNFETAEEAVQYLEQNRVLRLHDVVRLNKYSNPNIVLNTVDRFGIQIINSQDLLAVLSAFGSTMNGMDSPYGSQPTDYDTAEYTGSQVIDQIVTDFIDTITVEQYHRILNDQYPNPNTGVSTSGIDSVAAMIASSGAYSGYFGADFDYTCSTPTLLFFLSQYGADNGITLEGLAANPDLL